MKRNYVMMTMAAAMLASCAQTGLVEEIAEEPQKAIGFSTFADKQTKANSTSLNDFYKTFNVYGWKQVNSNWSSVFNNVTNEYFDSDEAGTVVYKTSKPSTEWKTPLPSGWYYENIRYWDKKATAYQFCAYAPIGASSEVTATETGVINIGTSSNPIIVDNTNLQTVPTKNLKYKNFVKDYMTAESTGTSSPVALTFTHELAKFNVQINKATSYTSAQELKVTKLEVLNLKNKGYFVRNKSSKTWNTAADPNEGTYAQTEEYSLTAATNYDGCYFIEQLLLPQDIDKASSDESISEFTEACVRVTYKIGEETFDGYYALSNIFDSSKAKFTFAGGKEYTLTITIGPAPIYFSTEVTPWTQGNESVTID